MTNAEPISVLEEGSVAASVYQLGHFEPNYWVTLKSSQSAESQFSPHELPMLKEAAEQAYMFIRFQEQMARMNWCRGCGDG